MSVSGLMVFEDRLICGFGTDGVILAGSERLE
jgi:hypothetical protein